MTCDSENLNCFILDNNAYIVLSDEIEYTGRYFGDIRPDVMYHLIKNKVYKATEMFDYQAICQKLPLEKKTKTKVKKSSSGKSVFKFFWVRLNSRMFHCITLGQIKITSIKNLISIILSKYCKIDPKCLNRSYKHQEILC